MAALTNAAACMDDYVLFSEFVRLPCDKFKSFYHDFLAFKAHIFVFLCFYE